MTMTTMKAKRHELLSELEIHILAVAWLDNEQATRVLERLKKWRAREFTVRGKL